MITGKVFQEIAKHRRLVEKHKNLLDLFTATFDIINSNGEASALQKEFLVTELAFSYLHFGFAIFSPMSLFFLQKDPKGLFCIPVNFIEKYIFHLKEFVKEEINLNKRIEYDESILDESFAREFIKRIVSCDEEEDISIGLILYPQNEIQEIRSLWRSLLQGNSMSIKKEWKEKIDSIFLFNTLKEEFIAFLHHIQSDALHLMNSRLECFVFSPQSSHHSVFLFKETQNWTNEKSRKLSGILSLLLPLQNKNGEYIFKETPLTINDMTKLFLTKEQNKNKEKNDLLNIKVLKNWIGLEKEDLYKVKILEGMEEAVECGMAFKIPKGEKNFAYGLSETGQKMMKPFQMLLSEALCKHPDLSCNIPS